MGSDGMFSVKILQDGIAPEGMMGGGDLDLMVGSPMRIERKQFRELAVPYGVPASVRNRLDHVDVLWPSAPAGAVAFDQFPARDDNTPMPGGRTVGEYLHSQSVRRRAILARLNVAYVFRHAGDEPLTVAHVQAAYEFVRQHRNDPAEPAENPLTRVTYEESQVGGISLDRATGVGVKVRPAGDTSEADEEARIARLSAAPMHDAEGRPLEKET